MKKSNIYKNDIKFNDQIDIENSEFESEEVKDTYIDYNKKPKIEFRIKDCEMENYEYLDLSDLHIDDLTLVNLFNLDTIKYILTKIKFLDLSSNNLKLFPNINDYSNIIYFSISNNKIENSIINNTIKELSCENNKIKKIISDSIEKLSASNNLIEELQVPNIKIMFINDNEIKSINYLKKLEYLECSNNKINKIENIENLVELYASNNDIVSIDNLENIKIINCIDNPIIRIKYFSTLNSLITSTPHISKKYIIENLSKIKKNYLINFKT